jgi:hypothetical protein
MRISSRTTALACLLAISAAALPAQGTAVTGIAVGHTDVGPVIGLGGIGDAGLAFGGRFSRIFKPLPDMGNGLLGFTVSADYWSFGRDIGAFGDFDWSYLSLGGTVDYHFNVTNKKIDPSLGLGLGYQIVSSDYDGPGGGDIDASSLYFAGRAAIKYFMNPKLALYADAGVGAAAINLGVMFKLR